jgi:hypothetical protein
MYLVYKACLDVHEEHQQPGRFGFPGRVAMRPISSDLSTSYAVCTFDHSMAVAP